jgi:hypothetical protein
MMVYRDHKLHKIVIMRVTFVRVEKLLKLNYSTYKTDASCSLSFCVKMILGRKRSGFLFSLLCGVAACHCDLCLNHMTRKVVLHLRPLHWVWGS